MENFMKDEVEIAARNRKRRKSSVVNNVSAEIVEAGGKAW